MRQNPRLTAIYAPQNRHELNAQAEEWVGWEGEWEVTHLLASEDGESLAGMPLCALCPGQNPCPPPDAFVWVPISDLASIKWAEETAREAQAEQRTVLARQRFVDAG